MSCASLYAPQLRARGFRMTPQRMAILHVLHHSGRHLSPVEVFQHASVEVPGLTEATVYRTLEFLAGNGLVMPAHMGSGRLVYQISGRNHHHLICRRCRQEFEVEHSRLETLFGDLESASGYKLTAGHATFFGLCPKCQKTD